MKLAIITNKDNFIEYLKNNNSITIRHDNVFDLSETGFKSCTQTAIDVHKLVILYNENEKLNEIFFIKQLLKITTSESSLINTNEIVLLVKQNNSMDIKLIKEQVIRINQEGNIPVRLELYDNDSFNVYRELIEGQDNLSSVRPKVINRYIGKKNSTESTLYKEDKKGTSRPYVDPSIEINYREQKSLDLEFAEINKDKKVKYRKEVRSGNLPKNNIPKESIDKNHNTSITIVSGVKYSGKTTYCIEYLTSNIKAGKDVIFIDTTNRPEDYNLSHLDLFYLEEIKDFSFMFGDEDIKEGNLIKFKQPLDNPIILNSLVKNIKNKDIIIEVDLDKLKSVLDILISNDINIDIVSKSDKKNIEDSLNIYKAIYKDFNIIINNSEIENRVKQQLNQPFINSISTIESLYSDTNQKIKPTKRGTDKRKKKGKNK